MAAPNFAPANVPPRSPTMVTGVRDPSTLVSQRIVDDVSDVIAFVRPSANPLAVVTMGIKKLSQKKATQRQFDWLEKDPLPETVLVNGAQTAGDTALEVNAGHGARGKQYDLWLNTRTNELILVSSVSTDTWTVVRNVGGSNSAAILDQDELLHVGNAYDDGVGVGALKSVVEARLFNYTQILRTPFGFTRRDATMSLHGGDDPETEEKAQAVQHGVLIEKAAWFGQRFNRTGASGREQTAMGGIDSFITTNIWNLNNELPTEMQIVAALEQGMFYGKNGNVGGGGDKLLFGSRNWGTFLHRIYKDQVSYTDMGEILGKGRFGMRVGEIQTTHGRLVYIPHPLFPADRAYVIDPAHVWMRYHQGGNGFPDGKTKVRRNIENPDIDGATHEFLSDIGIQVELEMAHMAWKGLPSAA